MERSGHDERLARFRGMGLPALPAFPFWLCQLLPDCPAVNLPSESLEERHIMKMNISLSSLILIVVLAALTGCATSQNVTVGQLMPQQKLSSAALVPQDGNSPEMSSQIQQQLLAYGITPKPPLPAGTRQSNDVDLIITYSDSWRWDLAMYLKSLTINIFDGPTGNLLVTGRWENSTFHGFQNSRDVIKQLLDDVYGKLKMSK
jgi:hypothetical protein